jgi:hypothetical protein
MAVQAPASAQQGTATVGSAGSERETRIRDTNQGLLTALLARRAEIAGSAMPAEEKRYALDYIDRQVSQIRAELSALDRS